MELWPCSNKSVIFSLLRRWLCWLACCWLISTESLFVSAFPTRLATSCLQATSRTESQQERQGSDPRLILPVFPLRKIIRLPTEKVTLNLYEERYLEMAEYVLKRSNGPIFGALYTSDKPQIVRNGGPIVPVVEEGDIGVVCLVQDSEEAFIPTVGGNRRRRIRLIGRGAVRFQVTRILHNGFGGGTEVQDGNQALPFILVESRLITNVPQNQERGGELTRLQETILERLSLKEFEKKKKKLSESQCLELASKTAKIVNLDFDLEDLEAELLSFANIASSLPENATTERRRALCDLGVQSRPG